MTIRWILPIGVVACFSSLMICQLWHGKVSPSPTAAPSSAFVPDRAILPPVLTQGAGTR
jgi:hypothetical protein